MRTLSDAFAAWLRSAIASGTYAWFTGKIAQDGFGLESPTRGEELLDVMVERGLLTRRVAVYCASEHPEVWVAPRYEDIPFDILTCPHCAKDGHDYGEWQFRREYPPVRSAAEAVDATDWYDGALTMMHGAVRAMHAMRAENYVRVPFVVGDERFEVLVLRASGDRKRQMAAARSVVDRLGRVVGHAVLIAPVNPHPYLTGEQEGD